MYVFLLILLFIGSIMVIDGIYREELESLKSSKKQNIDLYQIVVTTTEQICLINNSR